MLERNGLKWSREETILAFELYCRTPFSKISSGNKEIIELAKLLGRTPSSVGLKMHNLAHFDPNLKERNVTAMSHVSKLDKIIFEEFTNEWSELSFKSLIIKAEMKNTTIDKVLESEEKYEIPLGEDREQTIKSRIGQSFFRKAVLTSYNNRCCVTGLSVSELLVASHIKPWKDSDEKTERTNPCNGLCFNTLHDKAFDRGLITLDKDYRIIISSKLNKAEMDNNTKDWLLDYKERQIILPDRFLPDKDFIRYHNDFVFQK